MSVTQAKDVPNLVVVKAPVFLKLGVGVCSVGAGAWRHHR